MYIYTYMYISVCTHIYVYMYLYVSVSSLSLSIYLSIYLSIGHVLKQQRARLFSSGEAHHLEKQLQQRNFSVSSFSGMDR